MLEERVKRSAKKTPAAAPPSARQAAERERPQREHPSNPNATFMRKPAQQPQEDVPNKLKYGMGQIPDLVPPQLPTYQSMAFYCNVSMGFLL